MFYVHRVLPQRGQPLSDRSVIERVNQYYLLWPARDLWADDATAVYSLYRCAYEWCASVRLTQSRYVTPSANIKASVN